MSRSFIDAYFIKIITSFSNSKFYEFNLTAKNGYKNLRSAMNKWEIGFNQCVPVFFTNYQGRIFFRKLEKIPPPPNLKNFPTRPEFFLHILCNNLKNFPAETFNQRKNIRPCKLYVSVCLRNIFFLNLFNFCKIT